jgi:hypothetical protein
MVTHAVQDLLLQAGKLASFRLKQGMDIIRSVFRQICPTDIAM